MAKATKKQLDEVAKWAQNHERKYIVNSVDKKTGKSYNYYGDELKMLDQKESNFNFYFKHDPGNFSLNSFPLKVYDKNSHFQFDCTIGDLKFLNEMITDILQYEEFYRLLENLCEAYYENEELHAYDD